MSNMLSRDSESALLGNAHGGGWLSAVPTAAGGFPVLSDDCSVVDQPGTRDAARHEDILFDVLSHAHDQRTGFPSNRPGGNAAVSSAVNTFTFKIARDQAVSFMPTWDIGLLQITCDDERTGLFGYRADHKGYIEPLCNVSTIDVLQQAALSGTSNSPGTITCSVSADGRIYVENRSNGPSRTFLVFTIGMRD